MEKQKMEGQNNYYSKYLKYKTKYYKLLAELSGGVDYPIPHELPGTQSWLYVPLIYSVLEDVVVEIPVGFDAIFLGSIAETKAFYTIELDFVSFAEFQNKIRERLGTLGMGKQRTVIMDLGYEDSEWHLSAAKQEEVLYINYTYETFLSVLVNKLIANMAGANFKMNMR
jgi:hypothetical protein